MKTIIRYSVVLMMLIITLSLNAQVTVVKHKRVPPRGRTVVRVNNSVTVVHRGASYRYAHGVFYKPVPGRGYVVVAPPLGVRVAVLPPKYTRVYVAGVPFFYYAGVYYRPVVGTSEYVVVKAPVGARVTVLPVGYTIRVIGGVKHYVVDNTYYVASTGTAQGYEVVSPPSETEVVAENADLELMSGARLPHLPEGAEEQVIDNQKFYIAKGVYYKEVIDDNTIWYEVVGAN